MQEAFLVVLHSEREEAEVVRAAPMPELAEQVLAQAAQRAAARAAETSQT